MKFALIELTTAKIHKVYGSLKGNLYSRNIKWKEKFWTKPHLTILFHMPTMTNVTHLDTERSYWNCKIHHVTQLSISAPVFIHIVRSYLRPRCPHLAPTWCRLQGFQVLNSLLTKYIKKYASCLTSSRPSMEEASRNLWLKPSPTVMTSERGTLVSHWLK